MNSIIDYTYSYVLNWNQHWFIIDYIIFIKYYSILSKLIFCLNNLILSFHFRCVCIHHLHSSFGTKWFIVLNLKLELDKHFNQQWIYIKSFQLQGLYKFLLHLLFAHIQFEWIRVFYSHNMCHIFMHEIGKKSFVLIYVLSFFYFSYFLFYLLFSKCKWYNLIE